MTWRLHIEWTTAKTLGMYIGTYSLFKIMRLNSNVKLIAYRALIRSQMTYACAPGSLWHNHVSKLQHMQSRVLHTVGDLDRCTPVRNLHLAVKIPYAYYYITNLCRRQEEVIQNHQNLNVQYYRVGRGHAQKIQEAQT
jgi:hypothetical protein